MKIQKFLEQYANRESENKLLKTVILILAIAIILEGFIVAYLGFTERTIIVPSHIDRRFFVEGDKASKEYIEMMSRYAIELISSFTPETVDERFSEFLRFINAAHYNKVSPQLLTYINEIKRYGISQYYIPSSYTLEKNTITVNGLMRQFAQDKQITDHQVTYKLQFQINNGRFEILTYEKIEQNT